MSSKVWIPPAMKVITNDIFFTYQIAVGIIRTISFLHGVPSNKPEKLSLSLTSQTPLTPQTPTRTRPTLIPKRSAVLQTIASEGPFTTTTFPTRIVATPALVDTKKGKLQTSATDKKSSILIEEDSITPLANSLLIADFSSEAVAALPKNNNKGKRKYDVITESDQSSMIAVRTRTNPFNTRVTSSSSTEKGKDISSDNNDIAAVLLFC